MRTRTLLTTATPAPLVHGVVGTFQTVLLAVLVLLPTAFGHLHRYGGFDLLLVVCLLHAFWVITGLLGVPLWHLRCWANLAVWAVLALLLAQAVPLPLRGEAASAAPASLFVDLVPGAVIHHPWLPVSRYSLRPAATVGVLVLTASAAALYWVIGSAPVGRKRVRRATWAVILGVAAPAYWMAVTALSPAGREPDVARPVSPMLILGGDSLVPALLAALPLCLAAVVRLLGWMPHCPAEHRRSRWGWLGRGATVWSGIGLIVTGLVAAALGMSHVPRHVLAAGVLLAVVFVLGGYVRSGPGPRSHRRPARTALALALWVAVALALGSMLGGERHPAASANDRLAALLAGQSPARAALGEGAGSLSPRVLFGASGFPTAAGDDVDADGFLVMRAEVGWVGLALVLAGSVALAAHLVAASRRAGGPWTRTVTMAGVGALAANLFYFRFDASAILAPNLVVLACVLGVVTAWVTHGTDGRRGRAWDLGRSHWPMVFGAVGLISALGLAENDMLSGPRGGPELGDKVLHFGTFAVVSLLLCYALGPRPKSRYLAMRILLAVAGTALLGVAMEFGQAYLTEGRVFEAADIAANVLGASLMGLLFWVVRRGQADSPRSAPQAAP